MSSNSLFAHHGSVPIVVLALGLSLVARAEAPDFQRDVFPILEAQCFECHGPDARKGGLRLSNAEDFRLGGDSGHSPAKPDEAGHIPLLQRLTTDDEALRMPPKGPRVPPEQIATLKAWIEAGAPWAGEANKTGAEAEKPTFWSFQPPEAASPPQSDWGRNPIDGFIHATMNAQGLSPSPEADRNTLIRRLSLDLRGLPPTPREVRDFINDDAPDAYEALVERYLASPHYGERQAIAWLDVARYADTNGYEKDRPRSIWPYRDWVIDALNEDMPFDRFVIEQIAGDMLPSPTLDQRIATGFHRNVMLNEEGGIDVDEFRYKNVVDRTNTTATALLGLTMSCAQCHTHKYDPITQREYYQLFAFFNNTDDVTLKVPDPEITKKQQAHDAKIDAFRASLYDKFPAGDTRPIVRPMTPANAVAETGDALAVDSDGTVQAPKNGAEKATYILKTTLPAGRVDGVILDVFQGENGPGRAPHGNFVLSEITARPLQDDAEADLRFTRAETEFSQEGYPIANAIDGKLDTGWAIAGDPKGLNRDHAATFYFETPLNLDAPLSIEVRLAQQFGKQHTFGDFRLSSLTLQAPDPAIPEAERREQFFAKEFDAWRQATRDKAQPWKFLIPLDMRSKKKATLVRLDDESILATGNLPNNDIYDLSLRTSQETVTGLRLEVLPHESLPGKGPGRGVILSKGDFLLTGVKIFAAPWNDPEARQPVEIASATESYASGDKKAAKSLDGKADTGWSIKGEEGQPNAAVYTFAEPVSFPGGTLFYITLEQKYIHQHTLGRFRLSVTGAGNPVASGVPDDVERLLLAEKVSESQQDRLRQYFLEHTPHLAEAQAELKKLEQSRPEHPTTLALEERERVRDTHIHHRGEYLEARAQVRPDVPEVLPPLPEYEPRNRLTLAKWLVSEDNPLTARVTMNRLWQRFFGRGLVPTAEDFGIMGEAPSHPELLDWLAVEFMRRGWRQKDMVRLIVTSATYRQSARISPEQRAIDPTNVYLARAPRFRVDAELVRDIALAASGTLDTSVGGPSVFPPLPDGLLQFVYGGFKWKTDTGPDRHRRGMYTYWKRMLPYPTAAVFDAPARDMVCVRRLRTNTPMQALTLLNDEVFMEAAREMAHSLMTEVPTDSTARLRTLFLRCLARTPDATEEEAMLRYLEEQRNLLAQQPAEMRHALLNGAGNAPEPVQIEQAAWTLLCRVVLNLDETITRG